MEYAVCTHEFPFHIHIKNNIHIRPSFRTFVKGVGWQNLRLGGEGPGGDVQWYYVLPIGKLNTKGGRMPCI